MVITQTIFSSVNMHLMRIFTAELYFQETHENLRMFEQNCMSLFLSQENAKNHNSLEERINKLEVR